MAASSNESRKRWLVMAAAMESDEVAVWEVAALLARR